MENEEDKQDPNDVAVFRSEDGQVDKTKDEVIKSPLNSDPDLFADRIIDKEL